MVKFSLVSLSFIELERKISEGYLAPGMVSTVEPFIRPVLADGLSCTSAIDGFNVLPSKLLDLASVATSTELPPC